MNILLLGSSGMVGRNILEHPKAQEFHFYPPRRSEVNLLVLEQLKDFMGDKKIDAVIHAAGEVGGIQDNINRPFDFLYQNLQMNLNIFCTVKDMEALYQ